MRHTNVQDNLTGYAKVFMLSGVGTNKVQKLTVSKKKQLLLIWMSSQITQMSHAVTSTSWSHFLILHSLPHIHSLFEHSCNSCMCPYMSKLAEFRHPLFLTFCFTHMVLKLAAVIWGHLHIMTFSSCSDFSVLSCFLFLFLFCFSCCRIAKNRHEGVSITTWKSDFSPATFPLYLFFFLSTTAWYKNIPDISTFTGTLVSFPRPHKTVSVYVKIIMEIPTGVCVAVNMNSFQHYTSNHDLSISSVFHIL